MSTPSDMEIELIGDTSHFSSVCELGNKVTAGISTKIWYTSRGMDYISIDWNGLNGAIKLDLQKPIELGPFDLLTNFGTTEHVENQEGCWRNVHNLTKKVSVHLTPVGPNWEKHDGIKWLTPIEFYKEFAELNGYIVDRCDTVTWPHRLSENRLINRVRLTKVKDLTFTMPKTIFEKIG